VSSSFPPKSAKDIAVERTGQLACPIFDEGKPMVVLVAAAFFMSLILLVPAVIGAIMSWCRVLHRNCFNEARSSRASRCERESSADSRLAEGGSITVSKENTDVCQWPSGLNGEMG
jgi:hypothetical protein